MCSCVDAATQALRASFFHCCAFRREAKTSALSSSSSSSHTHTHRKSCKDEEKEWTRTRTTHSRCAEQQHAKPVHRRQPTRGRARERPRKEKRWRSGKYVRHTHLHTHTHTATDRQAPKTTIIRSTASFASNTNPCASAKPQVAWVAGYTPLRCLRKGAPAAHLRRTSSLREKNAA